LTVTTLNYGSSETIGETQVLAKVPGIARHMGGSKHAHSESELLLVAPRDRHACAEDARERLESAMQG
jgi:hypothetical protein